MGTLSRVVYCLLLQTAYDWPKALNARLRKKYEKNLKAWDGKLKKIERKNIRRRKKKSRERATRRITSETVPSRTRRNWGPAPGPRDARWEEVAYPYPNFLPGVFWSRRTPNADGAVAPQVSARLPHTAGAPIPKELGVGTRPKRCTLERSCFTISSLFCQVFSAMRAELRRALTTATAPCTITLGRRWRLPAPTPVAGRRPKRCTLERRWSSIPYFFS